MLIGQELHFVAFSSMVSAKVRNLFMISIFSLPSHNVSAVFL